jgi:hypothetical protein
MTRHIEHTTPASEDVGAYCREVESHLCRVNGGHLVRIVGPAFVLVSGWAGEGIPLRIVLHGVDRTVTRLTAKGPRRRPVRIEFCEADVRDAFDQWRRAAGVRTDAQATSPADSSSASTPHVTPAARTESKGLPRHLERVLVRLSALMATRTLPGALRDGLERTIREIDGTLDASRTARGEARSAIIERLIAVEQAMTAVAIAALPSARHAELRDQASQELSPYRGKMPAPAMQDAEDALFGELVRRHFSLPQVRLDG